MGDDKKQSCASVCLNALGLLCGTVMVALGVFRLLSLSIDGIVLGCYYIIFGVVGVAVECARGAQRCARGRSRSSADARARARSPPPPRAL